jgi:peptidoglycan/LPS O-acetylase OafA/YrhL
MFFIVAYHFSFDWAGGGFLGVDVFFVLSGYLVTSKILAQVESGNDFSLKKFWKGRMRRLLPAVYTMIGAVVGWVILFNRELLSKLWGDAASSIFNVTNWWFIFHKLSYFDSFGSPSSLKHLWFLSLQEQFFIIWPVIIIVGHKYLKKRVSLWLVTLVLALLSALLMGVMYNPDLDPSRVYYGTDTRSFELFTGCLMALSLPLDSLLKKKTSNIQRIVADIAGTIALGIFIVSALYINEFEAFLYRGGFFLTGINAAVIIICISISGGFLGRVLSWKPIRWIGTRSYQIYLWHYPIMILTTPVYEIGNPSYWRVGLQLAATCIVSELSYRFIEIPVRRDGFRGFWRKYLSINIFKWGQLTFIKKISSVIFVILIVVLTIGITSVAKDDNRIETSQLGTSVYNEVQAFENEDFLANRIIREDACLIRKKAAVTGKKQNTNTKYVDTAYKKILAIGDSIMLDISRNLKKTFDNITIDGKVSRQMSAAIKLVPTYKEFNDGERAVIIELGTNGFITEKQADSLLDSFSKADIYLVNTRVPRRWEKTVNEILQKEAEERDNVILIDWYSEAIEHPEYFGRDGVHLTSSGSKALTKLISDAVCAK